MKNSRAIAIETLITWEKMGEPIDLVLETELARHGVVDQRDASLVMALVYGVVRWQGYLDGLIADSARHPLKKMKPLTIAALRIGLYQLLFMDRIPESAAINETVEALKIARQPKWLTGFVNGLLRNLARAKATLPVPDDAAAMLSHPAWLVERWHELFGPERTKLICGANNSLPVLTLLVNTRRATREAFLELLNRNGIIIGEEGLFAPDAVRIPKFQGGIAELPGYEEGLFMVQDEAAQLVCHLLAPFASGAYLDGCAGLGGKALHLAQLLPQGSKLVVVEPSPKRQALLKDNMGRLGWPEIEIHGATLQKFAGQRQGSFTGILIDAPCSGLGVIRRQPDIRWQRSLAALQGYQSRQRELLASAAGLLGQDGVLVYATCSIDPLENDEVIAAFLHDHSEFAVTPAHEYLPEAARGLCDGKGFFKTTPEQGLDGFFAARLVKRGRDHSASIAVDK